MAADHLEQDRYVCEAAMMVPDAPVDTEKLENLKKKRVDALAGFGSEGGKRSMGMDESIPVPFPASPRISFTS